MDADAFDFDDVGELYIARHRRFGQQSLDYHRFDKASLAIRFAIEELATGRLSGTALECGGRRYNHVDIRRLYDSDSYPLKRRQTEKPEH